MTKTGRRKKEDDDEKDEKRKDSVAQILARKVTSKNAGPVLIAIGILYVVGTAFQSATFRDLPDTLQGTILMIVLVILGVTVAFCMCLDAIRGYLSGRRASGEEPGKSIFLTSL